MSKQDTGLNIVSMGGGTGLSTLLSGLKHYVGADLAETKPGWINSLAAVVTVTDDGGSSGRLREQFQMLPPGDIRNCLVALAEDEKLLTRLFQYRFESDGELSGHSFGNLILTALTGVTGDFVEAIKVTSEVLAIKGRIFPATMEDVTLVAQLEDGTVIDGETSIVASRVGIRRLWLSHPHCKPLPEAVEAIEQADMVTIGPGSLFTSIIPNLLVEGIAEAVCRSNALKIFICNVMTQPGETDSFRVEDHLRVLSEYCPDLEFDIAVVNSAHVTPDMQEKYVADGAVQVLLEKDARLRGGMLEIGSCPPVRVLESDLLEESDVVRHDPHKLARMLVAIATTESPRVRHF